MNCGDFTITKREILVSIAITLVLIGVGFLISSAIRNGIYESNEEYYKSLKINDNEDEFKYAIKTNIGYVLAHGKVTSVNGISIPDIEGNYFYIKKVKEEYTRHTRQVAHTRTVSDGKGGTRTETYYTTEVYYSWDYAGSEEFHTDKFRFLDVEFPYDTIHFGNDKYLDTIKKSSDIRYKYYIIPFEFECTLFTYIKDNTISRNEVYYSNINTVIENKQKEGTGAIVGFWIIWIIVIGLLDFGYVYMENKYLED